MRSEPSLARSRTRGQRTATGPMPVIISRSGRCPWRTSRWRPSSVSLSAWLASKTATSASTACASSARAPLRRISVSGSAKVPGWQSWKTLALVTAYHSFGGEVEASSTPTIRRLTPSCRHQLSLIAPLAVTGAARSDVLPDIPTVGDFVPGYESSGWHGVAGPKNTPPEIIDKLNKEINVALTEPRIKARIADLGGTVFAGSPSDFSKLIVEETEKWAKVIKFSGAKPEG